jgi:hypothetical protein
VAASEGVLRRLPHTTRKVDRTDREVTWNLSVELTNIPIMTLIIIINYVTKFHYCNILSQYIFNNSWPFCFESSGLPVETEAWQLSAGKSLRTPELRVS